MKPTSNLALDAFNASVNMLSLDELRQAQKVIEYKIAMAAERHHLAILAAIEAAKADGFTITISHEEDLDICAITPDDNFALEIDIH